MEIKILEFEIKDNIVYYLIQLNENNLHWNFKTRYSILNNLHKELKVINNKSKLPYFPKKKLFGSKKNEFLQRRMLELENYINSLIKQENILNLRPLHNYFSKIKNQKTNENSINNLSNPDDNIENLKSKTDINIKKEEIIQKELEDKKKDEINVKMVNIYKKFQIQILNIQKFTEYIEENEEERNNKIFNINVKNNTDFLNPEIFDTIIDESYGKENENKEDNDNKEDIEKNFNEFNENLNLYLKKLDHLEENYTTEILKNSESIIHIKV